MHSPGRGALPWERPELPAVSLGPRLGFPLSCYVPGSGPGRRPTAGLERPPKGPGALMTKGPHVAGVSVAQRAGGHLGELKVSI